MRHFPLHNGFELFEIPYPQARVEAYRSEVPLLGEANRRDFTATVGIQCSEIGHELLWLI